MILNFFIIIKINIFWGLYWTKWHMNWSACKKVQTHSHVKSWNSKFVTLIMQTYSHWKIMVIELPSPSHDGSCKFYLSLWLVYKTNWFQNALTTFLFVQLDMSMSSIWVIHHNPISKLLHDLLIDMEKVRECGQGFQIFYVM